jgi:ubiquinol-cytochrome c reductase cytochrome b subunit
MSGSSNPLGVTPKYDLLRLSFYPFFYLKDIFGVSVFIFLFIFFIIFIPNFLGHADNYIEANSIVTPPHIVPE